MAQLITVRLNKSEQQPLGFRLQGGKDFGTPLVVQKVNGGSAAERAGLQAGDALIRVNNTEVYALRHQEAQDTIRAAGTALELTVQRGGGTWRPSVTPTGSLPRPGSRALGTSPTPVTNTSLKATPQASRAFGSGHNSVAKPFGYMNGSDSTKGIVNKQYNTPVNMYSDKTIAETLSAQTEVLAGGVLGVNFKKNEKTYDSEKSAVFKVLQEEQNDPEPEPPQTFYSRASVTRAGAPSARSLHSQSRTQSAPPPHLPKPQTRRVQSLSREGQSSDRLVPEAPHRPSIPVGCHQVLPDGRIALGVPAQPQPSNHLPVVSDAPFCSDCDSHIVGVFVRIKDKNLHVECFKCSTCGSSLKNQGYYNLNGKLYCDIHAKLVARQNPPAPNLEPVTVAPGGRIPTNPYTTPLPPLSTGNYTNGSSSLFSPGSNLSGPKPFGSSIGSAYSPSLSPRSAPMSPARPVVAPAHTPAPAAPLSAPFAPNKNVKSIVWPPPNPPEDDTPLQTSSEYAPSNPTGDPASFTTGTLLKKATESKVEKDQIVSGDQFISTSQENAFSSSVSFSSASMSTAIADSSFTKSSIQSEESQVAKEFSSCTVQSFSEQASSEGRTYMSYQTQPSEFQSIGTNETKLMEKSMHETKGYNEKSTIKAFPSNMDAAAHSRKSYSYETQPQISQNRGQFNYNNTETQNTLINLGDNISHTQPQNISTPSHGNPDENTIRTSPPRSRPSTPSLINKPAPIIPRYQMNLVTMEHYAPESHTYQPPGGEGSRTPTPKPRSRTPAQGPSSKAQAPRIKDYSQSNFGQSETFSHQLPSTFQRDLYPGQTQPTFYENIPPLVQEENRSNFERQSESYNKGDMSVKQDTMMNQNYGQRQMESQNVAEYGHTTVQTTRKTFEEYESAQTAKMIEIKKGGFASSDSYQPIEAFNRPSAINFKQSLPSPAMSFSPSTQNFSSNTTNENVDTTRQTHTSSSVGAAARGKTFGVSSAPKRGRGVLNKAVLPGSRVPLCGSCNGNVRGPFITALGRIWCPEHFICVNATCRRPLQDIGFVEENGQLYCEFCFEQYIAPACDKCHAKIKEDCLNAIGKHFHPECFSCVYCGKLFGNNPFFLEDGLPYCEADWNELFTTKCFACGFPVEAGDRWVEALNNNYHSQCFNCTVCKKNLEGQSFFARGGRPFCRVHAR
ncbi:PDZ and LIM domain protein Zasp isoform X2 [Pieris napi]|uniref:PDZ and LIM domain protein Zasp isoform X2 n=1 Tax=Pieris napi TaxID=78633 RepID=UPI001FBA3DDF|nr:PDZ and LIM domain protein Zasp isoform X2 [Pieris napi]